MSDFLHELLFPHPHMPGISADVLGNVNNWPISNTTTFMFFISFVFVLFTIWSYFSKEIPSFFQSLLELLIEAVENLLKSLTNGRDHRVKQLLIPISAIFILIGSVNIIGSFPIINQFTWSEGGHLVPLFRKATADINVTLPLAFTIVLMVQIFGIKFWGFFGYFKRFFPVHHVIHGAKNGISGILLGLVELFVGMLEFISEFIRIISLSLRLFGNMFAGEILLSILMGIFAIGLPAIWLGFDMMVAVIQTLVFGCLTTVYFMLVVKEEGQEGH